MVATVNGQEVCNSGAIYGGISTSSGEKGTITAMQNCYKSIKVKKGDNVTLEANYDLELHPPRMQHGVSLCLSLTPKPSITNNDSRGGMPEKWRS